MILQVPTTNVAGDGIVWKKKSKTGNTRHFEGVVVIIQGEVQPTTAGRDEETPWLLNMEKKTTKTITPKDYSKIH